MLGEISRRVSFRTVSETVVLVIVRRRSAQGLSDLDLSIDLIVTAIDNSRRRIDTSRRQRITANSMQAGPAHSKNAVEILEDIGPGEARDRRILPSPTSSTPRGRITTLITTWYCIRTACERYWYRVPRPSTMHLHGIYMHMCTS